MTVNNPLADSERSRLVELSAIEDGSIETSVFKAARVSHPATHKPSTVRQAHRESRPSNSEPESNHAAARSSWLNGHEGLESPNSYDDTPIADSSLSAL